MNVLTKYIAIEIAKGALLAMVLLITIFNLFTFSDELKDLGKGHYGLRQIFYYLALTTPRLCYEVMPASALLGSLFVLGGMANQRELIAMQAAGFSVFRIIKSVLLAGLLLVAIAVGVGEFIAPSAESAAQVMKITAQNEQVVMDFRYGLWLREGLQFINVRQIQDDGTLADISFYELDGQNRLQALMHADKASFVKDKQWRLEHVNRSLVSSQQMQATAQDDSLWQSSLAPDLLKIVVVKPNSLSLYDLALYIDFLKKNRQKSHTFELAFWGRIVNPLVTFVMLLVSTPFVVGIKRGTSAGGRMLAGVVIGMGFNVLDKIVSHMGLIYELNPPLTAFLPSFVVMLLALLALRA
ncbi:MAG: LPS export ABC transporter permease LptG [Methylococcaceae bacterium]|jgi:lipopolysaccharide export system permease protein